MEQWIALLSGIIGIVAIVVKWLYDKYKSSPKNKRLSYVEKRVAEKKRELEKYAHRDNLFGLSVSGSDIYDKLSEARRLQNSKSRKNSGKVDP